MQLAQYCALLAECRPLVIIVAGRASHLDANLVFCHCGAIEAWTEISRGMRQPLALRKARPIQRILLRVDRRRLALAIPLRAAILPTLRAERSISKFLTCDSGLVH
jgi:hypothetical protein